MIKKYIVCKETKGGYSAFLMIQSQYSRKFNPTDCRDFDTWDNGVDAAKYIAKERGIEYLNLR